MPKSSKNIFEDIKPRDRRLTYPFYPRNQVRRAGLRARIGFLTEKEEMIIENWRESHSHILSTWFVIITHRIKRLGLSAVPGQRLKRKKTIFDKLSRHGTHNMSLERMYDIAGCRIIFENLEDMSYFRYSMSEESRFKHKRKKSLHKDYINNPKKSGYRGIHDIYSYKSDPRRPRHWNNLCVEIQYRTKYQHAWATAVEIADIIKKSRTKFGDRTNEEQNLFFCYASEIIARVYEGKKSCCPELSNKQLVDNFNALELRLNLLTILKTMEIIKAETEMKGKKAVIIRLHIKDSSPYVQIAPFENMAAANKKLFELENQFPSDDIVLVKATNLNNIKSVFRNYFTDAVDFSKYMEDALNALNEDRLLLDIGIKRKVKPRRPKQMSLDFD